MLDGLSNSEFGLGVSELGGLVKRLERRGLSFRNAPRPNDTHFLDERVEGHAEEP